MNPVPRQGRYDLEIRNSSYTRDHAEFKCMMKQAGTGGLLHTSKVGDMNYLYNGGKTPFDIQYLIR